MEVYEREFLVSKIILGKSILKIKEDLVLIVEPLTTEKNFFAQKAYKNAYDDAFFSGVYTRKEMLSILEETGIWTEEEEKELKRLSQVLDSLKVRLFDNFNYPLAKEIRIEIKKEERNQARLHETKHCNDHLDCEGIASYSRWNWIIENNTFYEDGTQYDFSEVDTSTVLRYYHQSKASQEEIREVSRTDPWRGIWFSCGKSPKEAFQRPPNQLSDEQFQLIEWSSLYDNIAESSEPPSDAVIKDNYALDGWLIKERKKREKERLNSKYADINAKHQDADEVFIVARTDEEAQEIYELNDAESKFVIKTRTEELANKGEPIHIRNFRDQKVKAMNQANAKFGK